MRTPVERARENVTGIVSVLVTGFWMGALFTGQDWWLAALLIGYIVIVPLTALLFGDREDVEEWWDDEDVTVPEEDGVETAEDADALQTLRNRYARGELTDEEFERKVERLLETETISEIEEFEGRKRRPNSRIDRELQE